MTTIAAMMSATRSSTRSVTRGGTSSGEPEENLEAPRPREGSSRVWVGMVVGGMLEVVCVNNIVLKVQKLSKDKYQRIAIYNSIHSVNFLINTIAEDNNIIIVKVQVIR